MIKWQVTCLNKKDKVPSGGIIDHEELNAGTSNVQAQLHVQVLYSVLQVASLNIIFCESFPQMD